MRELLKVDWELSGKIAKRIDVVPNGCWRNSMLAQYKLFGSFYVEGWAVAAPFFMVYEHGWLEHAGKIIDVTWEEEKQRPSAYFAGVYYTREEAQLRQRQKRRFPFAGHLPKAPESYQLAYIEAMLYSLEQGGALGGAVVDQLNEAAESLRQSKMAVA